MGHFTEHVCVINHVRGHYELQKFYRFVTQEDKNIGIIGFGFEKNKDIGYMH
jgi:hypothetical protein